MKLIFDRTAAFFGLMLTAPVVLILIPMIRLGSAGPAVFAQRRVGKGGREFICYKLRTMAANTKQVATHEVSAAAVTPIGKILRRTKLDELPQLYNVMIGDMSLVGPRPCLPVQEELIHERTVRGVLEVLPGITGLGQVRGIDMSDPVRLADCDAEYVRDQSFFFDLTLIWRTVFGAGQGDQVRTGQPE
jgi:O-antigen biosynthesis protein WbqP